MAIYYVDLASGNDANAGTAAAPLLTINAAIAKALGPHDIRVAKTTAPTTAGGATTFTWTDNSATVTTSTNLTATLPAGTYISKPTGAGNGAEETVYRVSSITSTTITLNTKYHGTTDTTTGCLKYTIVTTGGAGANAVTFTQNGTTVSGGWNLGTETQDGETWTRSNNARTSAFTFFTGLLSNISISKMNIVETYYGLSVLGTCSYTFTNCTFYNYLRNMFANALGCSLTLTDSVLQNEAESCVYHANGTTSTQTYTRTIFMNGTVGFRGMVISSTNFILEDNKFKGHTSHGLQQISAPMELVLNGDEFRRCGNGIYLVGGAKISGEATFNNNSYAIYGNTITGSSVKGSSKSIKFNGNTIAIGDRMFSLTVEDCEFGNTSANGTDVYGDQYTSHLRVVNCKTTTPTNHFINKQTIAGTVEILDCEIDDASASKLFNNPTGFYNLIPNAIIKDSNQSTWPNGYYWPYWNFIEDASVTASSGSSFRLQFNTTVTGNVIGEQLIASCYTESGSGKQLDYKIMANSGWAGTLTPIIRLNGKLVYTGTPITTLTTSFVDKTLSITGIDVTESGIVEFLIIPNANTVACYIDDTEISSI